MIKHSRTRPVIAGLLTLAAIGLGCDKSPSAPSPSAAPIVTAASQNIGFTVTSISPTVGVNGEQVKVAGTGFLPSATLTLDGVEAKVTRITSTTITATTPVHAAGTVDVVVTNQGGQNGTLTGGYTFVQFDVFSVTASPSLVTSGDQLTMSWVAPSGRGCAGGGDWVTLSHVGDPDITDAANGHSDLWFVHLCAATSGTSTLTAPPEPGQYQFRYMVGDTGVVARSEAVTVRASTSPSPLVPTLTIDGGTASNRQFGETFWVSGSGYTAGRTVTRHINPAVNGSTVITPLTADGLGNLSWAFTPTCGTFDAKNTVAIYAVDDATGRTSNTITETVTGSCP